MSRRFPDIMSFIKSFILKASALLLLITLLCACEPEKEEEVIQLPGSSQQGESVKTEIVYGGTLRVPMNASPTTMHPLYVREALLRNVYSMVFEPLISFNELYEPTSCIAESWKYDAASGNWTIQLRANVHWHGDNGYLTGADAAYTINTIISDPESIYYQELSSYVELAHGYDNTLIIKAKSPSYALLYALDIPVIPQKYYEGKNKLTFDLPVGSGPFEAELFTFEGGTRMELKAFSKWWKKRPYIEKVVAIGYSNTEAVFSDFKSGKLDCVPSSLKTTEIYEILDGVNEISYLSHNYVFLGYNLGRGLMQNPVFRKAIAYAVNRTDIINNVYLKKATGAEQPLFNDTSLSSATVTRYDHNVMYAKELLESISYRDNDGDGYIDINGNRLVITLAVLNEPANPTRLEAAEYIASDLKAVGIYVNIVGETKENLKKTVEKKNYDVILSGYALSDSPSLDFIFRKNGSGNLSGYSSQKMDAALDNMKKAGTLEELKTASLKVQEIIAEDLPQIGLFFEMNTFLYSEKLHVSAISRETKVYADISNWHFMEE